MKLQLKRDHNIAGEKSLLKLYLNRFLKHTRRTKINEFKALLYHYKLKILSHSTLI